MNRVLLAMWIVLGLAILLTFCIPAQAQIVSFTPMGPETLRALVGRLVPGVAAVDVEICPPRTGDPGSPRVRAASVYQTAVLKGYEPIGPNAVDPLLTRELQRNWRRIAADAVAIGTEAGAAITASGTVQTTQKTTASLAIAGVVLTLAARQLQTRIPDPSAWRSKLLSGDLDLAAGRCEEGRIMFVRYRRDLVARTADMGLAELALDFKPERRR